MKKCCACKVELPDEAFAIRNRAKGWLKSECRKCDGARAKARKAKDPAAFNAAAAARKRAARVADPEKGKREYAAIREKERARHKRRSQDPEFRRKVAARSRAYYAANRLRHRQVCKAWAERNRERLREYFRQYVIDHRDACNEHSRKRRARKRNQMIVEFTPEQLDARMSVFGHRCAYCDGPFEHVDHVKPLSRGGPHCLSNLRPACSKCNLSKFTKPLAAWKAEQLSIAS